MYQNLNQLNEKVKRLPEPAQRMYLQTANDSAVRYGQERADAIAWKAVSSRFEKVGGNLVARSNNFVREVFIFKPKQIQSPIVVRSLGGDLMFEGVLATSNLVKNENTGKTFKFSKDLLQKMAEQGNKFVIKGDVDHKLLHALELKYGNNYKAIARELKNRQSPIRASRFDYIEEAGVGKLMIKALIDKEHKEILETNDFLSVEAHTTKREGQTFLDGNLIGFSLTQNPVDISAKIAA